MHQKESELVKFEQETQAWSTFSMSDGPLAFTPTTMTKIERTLIELNDEASMMASGDDFIGGYSDDDSQDSSSVDWTSDGKRFRNGNSTDEYMDISGCSSSTMPDSSKPVRRLPGPRASRSADQMTREEIERRQRRRERNKLAAAKCRQRRVDVTNELLTETQALEAETAKLEREIERLQRQKADLEFVLEAHKPMCQSQELISVKTEKIEVPVAVSNNPRVSTTMMAARPSFLPIQPRPVPTATTAMEVQVSTASTAAGNLGAGVFSFEFGCTGVTPISCSNQLFFTPSEFLSPTAYLLSPSQLLAQ